MVSEDIFTCSPEPPTYSPLCAYHPSKNPGWVSGTGSLNVEDAESTRYQDSESTSMIPTIFVVAGTTLIGISSLYCEYVTVIFFVFSLTTEGDTVNPLT